MTTDTTPADGLTTPQGPRPKGVVGAHGRKVILGGAAFGAALVLVLLVLAVAGEVGSGDSSLVFYTVQRGDLAIDVIERGNLESQSEEKVVCEVDDIEGDGLRGTTILWIVRNGESVEEGQLLVQLDDSQLRERLDRQVLDTERATSEQIQAKVKYENQQTQNETTFAEAQLKVDLAELALKQFEDEDGGTFQLNVQDIELQIQEAQAARLIEEKNLAGVEQLHKLGYRSRGELDQARLSALKAERQLATAISRKKELVEYQYRKTRMELEGAVQSARRALEQVQRDNEALLAQAKATMDAADRSLQKERERLARYREQVTKCKIYAPRSGMVAYATGEGRWRREEIRAGATVRPQQTILTIPNLKMMQVKTAVHESVLDQIEPGLPVTVRVDAAPDRAYPGSVQSVAVLPDQGSWMGTDTKVYETVVTIDEEVDQIKPGMTAVVEIHVAHLQDVLSVPVQAIVQVEHDTWCYVDTGGGVERRDLTLGRTNHKFVEIREGLSEGERVVLNPMAIFQEPERGRSQSPKAEPDGDGAEESAGELAQREDALDRRGGPRGADRDLSERRPDERAAQDGRLRGSDRRGGPRGEARNRPEGRPGERLAEDERQRGAERRRAGTGGEKRDRPEPRSSEGGRRQRDDGAAIQ